MVGKGRFFVGGNWKCNETVEQAKKLVAELNAGDVPDDIEIVVAPTYIHLAMVRLQRAARCWCLSYPATRQGRVVPVSIIWVRTPCWETTVLHTSE